MILWSSNALYFIFRLVATLAFWFTIINQQIFVLVRYCECFAAGIFCDGCNCVNCHNNVEHEAARKEAVETTLERNPHAFRPKIASSPHASQDARVSNLTPIGFETILSDL